MLKGDPQNNCKARSFTQITELLSAYDGASASEVRRGTVHSGSRDGRQDRVSPMSSTTEETIWVSFVLPSNTLKHKYSTEMTARDIKEDIYRRTTMATLASGSSDIQFLLQSTEEYVLKEESCEYYVTNETLPLRRINFFQVCKRGFITPRLTVVPAERACAAEAAGIENEVKRQIARELELQNEINSLLGQPLAHFISRSSAEVSYFRRWMTRARLQIARELHTSAAGRPPLSWLPQYRGSEPMPLVVPEKIAVNCNLPCSGGQMKKSTVCHRDTTIGETLELFFKKFTLAEQGAAKSKTASDFVLKVTGVSEYLIDNAAKLLEYDYIRKAIAKNEVIELSLVDKSTLPTPTAFLPEMDSFFDKILESEAINDEKFSPDSGELEEAYGSGPKPISIYENRARFRIKIVGVVNYRPRGPNSVNLLLSGGSSNGDGVGPTANAANGHANVSGASVDTASTTTASDTTAAATTAEEELFVMVELYHGAQLIDKPMCTSRVPIHSGHQGDVVWNEWLHNDLKFCDLPRGAKLCLTVFSRSTNSGKPSGAAAGDAPSTFDLVKERVAGADTKRDEARLWVNCHLVDHRGLLKRGPYLFRLWPADDAGTRAKPTAVCIDGYAAVAGAAAPPGVVAGQRFVMLEFYTQERMYYPDDDVSTASSGLSPADAAAAERRERRRSRTNDMRYAALDRILTYDALTPLTEDDRAFLWQHREFCRHHARALPRFLQSVNWCRHDDAIEARRLLRDWSPPDPLDALELLDFKFADPAVRAYAVDIVDKRMADSDLCDYLLQLVQVLKYEPAHNSPLARMLLRRCLALPRLGHFLFWNLKAELHLPDIAERFALLLESYLRGCGAAARSELLKQNDAMNKLLSVALATKSAASEQRMAVVKEGLARLALPERFCMPLDPRIEVKGLLVDKCRYMDSKKLPLWLVSQNLESPCGRNVAVIFKAGDDLRQDVLTLQMIRLMDKLWKQEGLDLRMNAYGCLATGDETGLIEVVANANTTANINKEADLGLRGTKAVLYKDTLAKYLRRQNPSDELYDAAVENFLYSCAGYCVATYILGIGDRHNDNIMLTKRGHLFHIDFGHFLGNYKTKYGFKRERAPFIFNPQFAYILGRKTKNDRFPHFVDVCCRAYNIVRKKAHLFFILFEMMLVTGLPELQTEEDLQYLKKSFALHLDEAAAAKHFEKQIYKSLKTKTVLINDVIHVWVHSHKKEKKDKGGDKDKEKEDGEKKEKKKEKKEKKQKN